MSSRTQLLLAIIAFSVVVRLGSAVYQGNAIEPLPGVTDQISYHALALRVLDGHGFSFATGWWPATRAHQPTAHWSFLYVLFLAAVYAIAGPVPLVARIVQAVIVGVLHPWLAWRIGSRVFNPTVGLVSAAMSAAYGYFAYYGGALVTESLYFVAFLWVLDLATWLALEPSDERRLGGAGTWALLGLAVAVAALLRQAFLLVLPAVFGWMVWEFLVRRPADPRLKVSPVALAARMAIMLAVLGACILPWTVRNYRAFGQFVLLNTNAGYVFFYGAHPVHGTHFVPIQANGSAAYQALLPGDVGSLNEAQLERALFRRGLTFVEEDPGRYLAACASRATEFFKFWPTADSGAISNLVRVLSFGLLAPFLSIGVVLVLGGRLNQQVRSKSAAVMLVAVTFLYTAIHLLTWTLVRYRLPIDAIVMPFAGVALVVLFTRLQRLVPAIEGPRRSFVN